jgi:hypothetical protein
MKRNARFTFVVLFCGALGLVVACGRKTESADAPTPHKHEHNPPHGGTPVVLGDEAYHLEFVLDAAAGKLSAYVLDGEMENFVRCSVGSFEVTATIRGAPKPLIFQAVANPATGETINETSLFEARADWLKATKEFDAVLTSIAIRGSTFSDVEFNFPKGNETD